MLLLHQLLIFQKKKEGKGKHFFRFQDFFRIDIFVKHLP